MTGRPAMTVAHNKVRLALHRLTAGPEGDGATGRPLLLLHGLGERAPTAPPAAAAGWPGEVWALDFTGHGGSTRPRGGGYTAEILVADVDAALGVLGPSTLLGRGLGAYVGLLAAGARPALVRGAVLTDGPGLHGGGPWPASPLVLPALPPLDDAGAPDPYALLELARDVRPPDYVVTYVRMAVQFSGLDGPLSVAAVVRPPWLEAAAGEPGVAVRPAEEALASYATVED